MRRLGLDMGTNSIGWCLIEDDNKIIDIGVRIFSDGRDPQSGTSLAVDRREARSARRRRDRYLRRRSAFLDTLVAHGLMPADTDEAKLIAELDPYALRAKALDAKLEPYEIGRALFHLNQRRGFKSNRKAERKTKDAEDGKIATGAKALKDAMEAAKARTLGEFLARGETKRVRMGGENQSYDFYPQRDHVLNEFKAVWSAQATHHPSHLGEVAFAALYRIIEFQRPLKIQPVGKCTFFEEDPRLAKSHPLFQERRLYEEVNHLEITTPGAPNRKLTLDERDRLILELRDKKNRAFSALATKLKLDSDQSFNKATETRTHLAGNEVYATMAGKTLFAKDWANISAERQWAVIDKLLQEENPERLYAFLVEEYDLSESQIEAAEKAARILPEGYGRLGERATKLILEELKRYLDENGEVITYDRAVQRGLNRHHSDERTGKSLDFLPYYGEVLSRHIPPSTQTTGDPHEVKWGKITNPTVHIGLRQLQKLVNVIIAVHGRPDEIVVELARELKLNDEEKKKHNDRIKADTIAAQKRSAKLIELGEPDTGANRARLRLWEELAPASFLDRYCPYCGKPINITTLFSSAVDVDHIIPYSKSYDDSFANKVVVHRNCNREKGKMTPYERWHSNPEQWTKITEQVVHLRRNKQWRFGPEAMEKFKEEQGFMDRQLVDTQYLSRLAGRYLGSLYPTKDEGSVYVIPGRMTAMLRGLWGLNDILNDHNMFVKASDAEKNRLDHRHHPIDAAVIAVTTRSLLKRIADSASRAENKELSKLFDGLDAPWPNFRDELREKLAAVIVSHKPDHGRKGKPAKDRDITSGQLHNATACGLTGRVNRKGDALVVYRVPLMSLQLKDFTDPERMTDHHLQAALYHAVEGKSGKELEQALIAFSKADGPFKGTRRVRVCRPLNVIPIKDKTGKAYKGYQGDSNALYNVWEMPDGKWLTSWKDREGLSQSSIISTFDYHQHDFVEKRPHPAAKKVLSLRQNDLLAIERDGAPRQIVRVQKYGQNGQIFLIAHNEAGNMTDRNKNPNDPFKFYGPGANSLKAMKARQVRIDPLGRIFDPGPR